MSYKIVLLCLMVLVGVGFMYKQRRDTPIAHVQHFHIKQCFLFNGEKDGVSGIISSIQGDFYLVMWYGEADRRYAGPKIGAKAPMAWLERYAHVVKCKEGWGGH